MGIKHPDNHKAYHTDVCDPGQDSLEMILRIRFADEKDAQPSFWTQVYGKTIAVNFSCGHVEMFVAIDAARFKERMVDIVQLFYGKWLRQQGREDEAPEAIITRGREWYVYASYVHVETNGNFAGEYYRDEDELKDFRSFFKKIDVGTASTKEELKYSKSQFLKHNTPILIEDSEFSVMAVGLPHDHVVSYPWSSDADFIFYSAPAPDKDFKGKKEVAITTSFAAEHIGISDDDVWYSGRPVIIGGENILLSKGAICSLVDGYRAQGMDVMICNYDTCKDRYDLEPARAYQLDVCSAALLSIGGRDEVEWFASTSEAMGRLWQKAHKSYSKTRQGDYGIGNAFEFTKENDPQANAYMRILTCDGVLNEKGKTVRKTFNKDKLTRADRLRLKVEMAYGDEERQALCRKELLEYLLRKKGLGSLSREINKIPDNEAEIWRLADLLDVPITAGVRQRWIMTKGADSLSETQLLTALDDLEKDLFSFIRERIRCHGGKWGFYYEFCHSGYDFFFEEPEFASGSSGCSIDQYEDRYGTLEEFAKSIVLNILEGRLAKSDGEILDLGYTIKILRDELGICPDAILMSNPDPESARRLEMIDLAIRYGGMIYGISRVRGTCQDELRDTFCAMREAGKLPFTLNQPESWDPDYYWEYGEKAVTFIYRTGRSQKVLMKLINSDNLRAVKYAYDIACGMRDCQTRKMVLDAYHERFKDKR